MKNKIMSSMNTSTSIYVLTILLLVVTIIFLLHTDKQSSMIRGGGEKNVMLLHLDYPVYDNASDLSKNSEYVFIGKVVGDGKYREVYRPKINDHRYPNSYKSIVYTDYSIDVIKTIKGDIKSNKITLSSMGGEGKDTKQVVEGLQGIDKGGEYMIFANKDTDKNVYYAISGFSAIAKLNNGSYKFSKSTGSIYSKSIRKKDVVQ